MSSTDTLKQELDDAIGDPLKQIQILVKQIDDLENQILEDGSANYPPGGTTGQVLAKASDDDNDVEWQDPTGLQGPPGEDGADGADGAPGADGVDGADGKTILYGTTNPTTQGSSGDFYINTATNFIFGPKLAGVWPAGVSLVGPQGPQGIQGEQGIQGIQGLKGDKGDKGDPGDPGADGTDGIDGAPGADGADGTDGVGVPAGGSANQILKKATGDDYDTTWGDAPESGLVPQGDLTTPADLANLPVPAGSNKRKLLVCQGSGSPITLAGSPIISNGATVGQELVMIGASDTNTLNFTGTTGNVIMNGPCLLKRGSSISFVWEGTYWVETSRNGK